FPFDRKLLGRRDASEKIQAEDYDRIRNMRAEGATCICHIEPGAWAKYENVDFGRGRLNLCTVRLNAPAGTRITFCLDKPTGRAIGRLVARRRGWREQTVKITPPRGAHTLYLVFQTAGRPAANRVDWLRFEAAGDVSRAQGKPRNSRKRQ
ncbi:MAG: carbohydrate-binding protein, partial [Planctomycetota bacterium]